MTRPSSSLQPGTSSDPRRIPNIRGGAPGTHCARYSGAAGGLRGHRCGNPVGRRGRSLRLSWRSSNRSFRSPCPGRSPWPGRRSPWLGRRSHLTGARHRSAARSTSVAITLSTASRRASKPSARRNTAVTHRAATRGSASRNVSTPAASPAATSAAAAGNGVDRQQRNSQKHTRPRDPSKLLVRHQLPPLLALASSTAPATVAANGMRSAPLGGLKVKRRSGVFGFRFHFVS